MTRDECISIVEACCGYPSAPSVGESGDGERHHFSCPRAVRRCNKCNRVRPIAEMFCQGVGYGTFRCLNHEEEVAG